MSKSSRLRGRMKLYSRIAVSALLVASMLPAAYGCAGGRGNGDTQAADDGNAGAASQSSNSQTITGSDQAPSAKQIVASMTLEEKVEQMLMLDFRQWGDGSGNLEDLVEMNDDVSMILSKYNLGGVILFSENFDDNEQAAKLIADMQHSATVNGLPLLIATDQEGGDVARLSDGTCMPGNMALGADGSTDDARTAAKVMGSELSAIGVNVDFAPDIDVNSNPSNPVIGIRSFSDDPAIVASLGSAFIDGLHDGGVAAAVKHFPGHGDTALDSHTGLPSVDKSLAEIEQTELVPFAQTVGKADIVMTAHIQFPQIETETYTSTSDGVGEITLPATLSKTFVTDILRGDLGFTGVVATDAMDMDAIADNFTSSDAARLAINAGVDLLVMPVQIRSASDLSKLDSYIADILDMVQTGAISQDEIDDSALRIVQLKIDRGIIGGQAPSADATSTETSTTSSSTATATTTSSTSSTETVAAANGVEAVGSAVNHEIERVISDRAITVVSNDGMLPVHPASGETVLFCCAYQNEADNLKYGFDRLVGEGIIEGGVACETAVFTKGDGIDEAVGLVQSANYVIVDSEITKASALDPAASWTSDCVDKVVAAANEAGVAVCVVSVGLPYDAVRYPQSGAMVIAYGARGAKLDATGNPVGGYGPNLPAAEDIIFGKVSPTGKLPVDIPALNEDYSFSDAIVYPRGYGISW